MDDTGFLGWGEEGGEHALAGVDVVVDGAGPDDAGPADGAGDADAIPVSALFVAERGRAAVGTLLKILRSKAGNSIRSNSIPARQNHAYGQSNAS